MSEAQANQMISNIEHTAQQAKQTTEKAANVTGTTFIGLAISMIIGAIVAMIGSLVAAALHPPLTTSVKNAQEDQGAGAYASTRP